MFLEGLLVGWFLVYFEPFKKVIKEGNIFYKIFSCLKCSSFWMTLLIYISINILNFNLFVLKDAFIFSIINSIIGYVYERIDNLIPVKA